MTSVQHHSTFGRLAEPHTVIIARGGTVRHFTIKPWIVATSSALASLVLVGYFGTAAYLVVRDDLLASGTARQARLQQAYEDRIASLRSQLDRAVSRQLIDQFQVETKVDVLIGQQAELTARYAKLQPLLDRAKTNGLLPAMGATNETVPVPTAKPTGEAPTPTLMAPPGAATDLEPLAFAPSTSTSAHAQALARFGLVDHGTSGLAAVMKAGGDGTREKRSPILSSDLIREIGRSIETVEDTQIAEVTTLAANARAKALDIAGVLRTEGIRLPSESAAGGPPPAEDAAGGPFVPVPPDLAFQASVEALDAALDSLHEVRASAERIPLAEPVAQAPVSSTFGVRADPFLGRTAMHTGIDFVALSGTAVTVTAPGTVVEAGPNGGYGNMVEVEHGGGVKTRYAHLSSIVVAVGDRLGAGAVVGRVGTTGRSTGPHLHYEVRSHDEPIDPARFLRAGRRIKALG